MCVGIHQFVIENPKLVFPPKEPQELQIEIEVLIRFKMKRLVIASSDNVIVEITLLNTRYPTHIGITEQDRCHPI